jgi:hypothetical protein
MIMTLTISRPDDDGGDLVISTQPADDDDPYLLPDGALSVPAFAFRYAYAPDSDYLPGKQLLGAVLDQATLPVVVHVRAVSTAALLAAQAVLEAAVSQWSYLVTVTLDGAARSWDADPSWPDWGEIDPGLSEQHMSRASIVIPVNPA